MATELPERMPGGPTYAPTRTAEAPAQPAFASAWLNYNIAVLIPCYNEERTVGKVVRDFRAVLPAAHIYVYDNNSTDATARAAAAAGAIVRREEMQGKGNVVRRMFRDIDADFYVLVDGDDTYEASAALTMLERAVEGPFDLVNGIRISQNTDESYRPGHQLGNVVLTGMVQFLFGDNILDMLSGYKVLSRRFVKSFPALSSGFETETELTVHALELAMPIAHVNTQYQGRPAGSASKLNTFRDGWRILLAILNLSKQERPLFFFSWVSFALAALSLLLAIPVVGDYLHTGLVPRLPTAVLATGIMLLAFLSLTCGLVLDTVTRGRREAKMLQYLSIPPIVAPAGQPAFALGPLGGERDVTTIDTLPRSSTRSAASAKDSHAEANAKAPVSPYEKPSVAYGLRFNVLLILASIVAFAILSALAGKDMNWDLRNYHYYDGYALATGVWAHNYFPAQLQSYFVPTLDFITYLLISHLPPMWAGMVIGGFQGLNFWLVFQIAARLIRTRKPWLQWVLWFGCAVVAMRSPTSTAELGNTMQDFTVSVLVLGGILLLLTLYTRRSPTNRGVLWTLGAAGLLLGVATGLKLTVAAFVVAAVIALLLAANRQALYRLVPFVAGAAIGFVTTAGYWLYEMYARFGNPLFPLYNAIFKSPYEVPANIAGGPFFPQTKSEWLFSPFFFRESTPYPTLEIPFRNLAFAAVYVLLVLLGVVLIFKASTKAHGRADVAVPAAIRAAQVRLVIFFVVGYILWEVLFSIYRYLSPLELLAPVVAVVIISWLTSVEALRAAASIALLALLALTMHTANWGRYPWGDQYFVTGTPTVPLPSHAVVVMTSYDPIGYLVPSFPADAQFVRVQSNFDGLVTPKLTSEEAALISAHLDNLYLLTTQAATQADVQTTNAVLKPYGVEIMPGTCQQFAPAVAAPAGAPGGVPAAYLCSLESLP